VPRGAKKKSISSKNLVGFRLDDVIYAIEIFRVREIIRPLVAYRLPGLPRSVIGVAHHRGDVIPVVDLRERFGLPARPDAGRNRWIIVTRGERLIALAVERITEVFAADQEQRREVPDIGAGEQVRPISAVYAEGGGLVFVIDVDRVTDVADQVDLSQARQMLGDR
jgi:purine-binding chemotaxis protein CheW